MKNELLGIAPTVTRALQILGDGDLRETLKGIAERFNALAIYHDHFGYGVIAGPLHEADTVCRKTYASAEEARSAVNGLNDRALGLIGRFANVARWNTFGIQGLARGCDPLEYLGYLAMSPQMTALALMCPTMHDIRDLRALLTDPNLTPVACATAILAQNPNAAAIIAEHAFSGPSPDVADRRFYYVGRPTAIRIGDADTGEIVYRGDLSVDAARALVKGLNDDVDLGIRFVAACRQVTAAYHQVRVSRQDEDDNGPLAQPRPDLNALREARDRIIAEACGPEAYAANRKRMADEHEAWLGSTVPLDVAAPRRARTKRLSQSVGPIS